MVKKKFKHANATCITATQERHLVGIRIINRRYQRTNILHENNSPDLEDLE